MAELLPTVSIVTPYFNAASYVSEFVDMLRRQSYQNWTCLLVDDNSTDSSTMLLRSYVNGDSRFQFFSTSPFPSSPGPSASRNLALDHVKTPLIAFCDIDDLWHPQKLELQIQFHCIHQLDFSVTSFARFDNASDAVISLHSPPPFLSYTKLLHRNCIPMLSVLCSSRLLRDGLRFPICRHEDYLAWLNVFRNASDIKYGSCPYLLSFYRVHSDNLTSNRLAMIWWVSAVLSRHSLNIFHYLWLITRWSAGVLVERISSLRRPFSSNLLVHELLVRPPLRLPLVESSSK